MEQEKLLEIINKEETVKLRIADTLKETVRMSGEFRLNSEMIEDDELKKIYQEAGKNLAKFNKAAAKKLSSL